MATLAIGSKHGSPRDGILVGHMTEDRLSFFDITIFSMFCDLGVAVNKEFAGFVA